MQSRKDVRTPSKRQMKDETELHMVATCDSTTRVGQVQELPREFSLTSLLCLELSLMATWEALSSVVGTALTNGGPPCLFYNYIISFLGTLAIACSLSEIASIWPTAGGQYHWVHNLSPHATRNSSSWVTGWINIGGQLVLTASAAFAAGLQLQGLIILNNPTTYTPQRWQGMLFYWLVLLYSVMINTSGSKLLPTSNIVSGVLHVAAFVAIIVTLAVLAPKASASYVFTEFSNTSGWNSDGISWLVGLLSTVYPFLGYDAACHLSEELPNPARNVPLAMIGSILINGILGFGYAIALLFSITDLTSLLVSTTGFPFMQLYYQVVQSAAGASIMVLCVSLIAIAANAAGLTSTSRTAWAFARDDAIPFSRYFAHVNQGEQVPTRMVWCISILQMLLGFIYLGNTTAFNAILSMAILGLYTSYLIPIVYMIVYGRRQYPMAANGFKFGPFCMGKVGGLVVNLIAVAWLVIAIIFSTFPSYEPVTAQNMNYSIVVMVGWLVIGLAYYWVKGRRQYNGPSMTLMHEVAEMTGSKDSA